MRGYEAVLASIPSEVSVGSEGVHICSLADLPGMQRGYCISSAGEPLCGDADGDWKKEWVVIGYETTCGDPIFIDSAVERYPVYTAMHGEGRWDPRPIAVSLDGFRQALEAIAQVAQGREDLLALEANPIAPAERDEVLRTIRRFNPGIDLDFWILIFGEDPEGFEI
jgi:hypothetical protein